MIDELNPPTLLSKSQDIEKKTVSEKEEDFDNSDDYSVPS